jgi:peptidoglycan/LPS O-acetylase OafA/YrhL
MGILRIYLALCVVAAHSNRFGFWPMHSGHEAVQIFFMISGFYMELVYEKYRSVREFYLSRSLRIFLPYWTVLALILVVSVILGVCSGNWAELEPFRHFRDSNGVAGVVLAGISNFTIFLQDAVMFLKDTGKGLVFTHDVRAGGDRPLWYYLVIPQAWSVSVELQFYLVMPLLARLKNHWLLLLILLSTAARIYVYEGLHWKDDPWTYRFSAFEVSFFMLGMLACRFWKQRRALFDRLTPFGESRKASAMAVRFGGILLACLISKLLVVACGKWIDRTYVELVLAAGWAVMLPLLFSLSRKDGTDRWIGELSYPVYLVHYFIIGLITLALGHPDLTNFAGEPHGYQLNPWTGVIAAVLSLAAAAILNKTLFEKLERLRHLQIRKATEPVK